MRAQQLTPDSGSCFTKTYYLFKKQNNNKNKIQAPGMKAHARNPSSQEVKASAEASLGYLPTLSQKIKTKNQTEHVYGSKATVKHSMSY